MLLQAISDLDISEEQLEIGVFTGISPTMLRMAIVEATTAGNVGILAQSICHLVIAFFNMGAKLKSDEKMSRYKSSTVITQAIGQIKILITNCEYLTRHGQITPGKISSAFPEATLKIRELIREPKISKHFPDGPLTEPWASAIIITAAEADKWLAAQKNFLFKVKKIAEADFKLPMVLINFTNPILSIAQRYKLRLAYGYDNRPRPEALDEWLTELVGPGASTLTEEKKTEEKQEDEDPVGDSAPTAQPDPVISSSLADQTPTKASDDVLSDIRAAHAHRTHHDTDTDEEMETYHTPQDPSDASA
jgi:hypothetical protein